MKTQEIVIKGEWRSNNSVKYSASLWEKEPGMFAKHIKDLDKGVTPVLPGDEKIDVINYFTPIYPDKKIVVKVD